MGDVMRVAKYFYRTGLVSLVIPALASFCLCACGTMASNLGGRRADDFTPMYYSGIRLDASAIAANVRGPDSSKPETDNTPESEETIGLRIRSVAFRTLDIPLSFAFDTVLLPFHAWAHLQQLVNPAAKDRSADGRNEAGSSERNAEK